MLDPDLLADTLDAASDGPTARKRGKHLRPLRGLRGVPVAKLAPLVAKAWRQGVDLERDADALHAVFMGAHEDGLLAIGLVAAATPDQPHAALDLVDRWVPMIDDVESCDALGWLVFGPALLVAGEPVVPSLTQARTTGKWPARRMAVMACMALLPEPVQGPSAAALRERMGTRTVAFVDAPQSTVLHAVCTAYLRDPDPHVHKALIRVLRTWAQLEPDAVQAWMDGAKGGVPKRMREELTRGIKKGRRLAAQA